ncbi:MAG: hypothetical protein GY719_12315 [bacterium]|nr:hypothetical protein [bacterium]
MRVFSALVWREVFERRLLLVTSFFLGLVPLIVPLMPGHAQRYTPEEVRFAVAFVLVALFGAVALLMLGSNIVGRDLSEGRLGFYFSRPVSPWALWLSRLTAAGLLLLGAVFLIAAPTAALDLDSLGSLARTGESSRAWPVMGLGELYTPGVIQATLPHMPPLGVRLLIVSGLLLLLLVIVHIVSSIVRARSLWLLADLAALALIVSLGWAARDLLVREQALGALTWAEWFLLPWSLGATLLAGGMQLAQGRTDVRRGHRVLSLTLWPVLLLAVLVFGAYARWATSSTIEDLDALMHAQASPDEAWVLAGGTARAGSADAFLLASRSGTSWRLGSLGMMRTWSDFSADGSTLAWVRCETFSPPVCEVWAKDLRDPASPPRATEVPITRRSHLMALSDDGSLVAFAESKRLVVYELASARVVAAVDAQYPEAVTFPSPGKVRFHENVEGSERWSTRIRQVDLATRHVIDTGRLPRGRVLRRSPHRDLMIFAGVFPTSFGLYDGETGEALADLTVRRLPTSARFFVDGRSVLTFQDAATLELVVLSSEGKELHRIKRFGVPGARFGGEMTPGRMFVALRDDIAKQSRLTEQQISTRAEHPGWTTYVLDADAGELRRLVAGVVPLGAPTRLLDDRLFLAEDESVIRWTPETGEQQIILRPGGHGESDEPLLPF